MMTLLAPPTSMVYPFSMTLATCICAFRLDPPTSHIFVFLVFVDPFYNILLFDVFCLALLDHRSLEGNFARSLI